jgi:hypothetical protein
LDRCEIEQFLDDIETFENDNSDKSYEAVRKMFDDVLFPVPVLSVAEGHVLVRGRPHTRGEKYFEKISQISYRDSNEVNSYGRANIPKQSMFYCSDNLHTSLAEVSHVIRNELFLDEEIITWGIWRVKEPFQVSYVINTSESQNKLNTTLKHITERFYTFLSNHPEDEVRDLKMLHNFISKRFQLPSKNNMAAYKVTSSYTNSILQRKYVEHPRASTHSFKLGGIMYASSIHPSQGMNLALLPEIVNGHLDIVEVRKDIFSRQGITYNGEAVQEAYGLKISENKILWDKAQD